MNGITLLSWWDEWRWSFVTADPVFKNCAKTNKPKRDELAESKKADAVAKIGFYNLHDSRHFEVKHYAIKNTIKHTRPGWKKWSHIFICGSAPPSLAVAAPKCRLPPLATSPQLSGIICKRWRFCSWRPWWNILCRKGNLSLLRHRSAEKMKGSNPGHCIQGHPWYVRY